MSLQYPKEKNLQMLIYLLKAHGIKDVVVSPGSTNMYLIIGLQQDNYFNLYSCIDERSAAYIACGIAEETGNPVVLSCTMATAARNYMPGMTEAYYRKLPILAITSTEEGCVPYFNIQHSTDRTSPPKDVARKSFQIPVTRCNLDEWKNNTMINAALIELKRDGGGPVHVNLMMEKNLDFSCNALPKTRVIEWTNTCDSIEHIEGQGIAIFVGSHHKWSHELTNAVDLFCEVWNAVVLYDCSSNYTGKYGVPFNLINAQKYLATDSTKIDLLIHIGEVSASKPSRFNRVWRISEDGEVKDTFKKLERIFCMPEIEFFTKFNGKKSTKSEMTYYNGWKNLYDRIYNNLLDGEKKMPFSSMWIAMKMHDKFQRGSGLYLAILNSLRCYNMLPLDASIITSSNVGGFGIDGCISSLVGSSIVNREKIFYGVVGDLAFFYDMNVLGNRHIGNNIRILIVNNGLGAEFKRDENDAMRMGLGQAANAYIAAEGHYGKKSETLVRHYAEDLGFQYLCAKNKSEFIDNMDVFLKENYNQKSIIFEVFTNETDDIESQRIVSNLEKDIKSSIKGAIKSVIGRQ